jgi:hypothetical protein
MAPSDSAAATSNGMARHGKDKACHISQFIAALQSEDPEHPKALCQLASQPCSCGYSWPSCPRILHAVALDALAECLNKADQHVNALSTALGTIRLDPACAVVSLLAWVRMGCLSPLADRLRPDRATAALLASYISC